MMPKSCMNFHFFVIVLAAHIWNSIHLKEILPFLAKHIHVIFLIWISVKCFLFITDYIIFFCVDILSWEFQAMYLEKY